jgi:hypothetical protein
MSSIAIDDDTEPGLFMRVLDARIVRRIRPFDLGDFTL